jgi:transcriptional regulator with XRE-family HTH domain
MPTTRNEFGRFFRSRRTALGLNLSEFCRQNGFDKGNVSRLERGLKKPPESTDLLRSYADALQLQPESEDWKAFMRHAAIARGKLPTVVSDDRAADVEEMFRRLGRRLHESWVKARDLEQQWSPTRDAQANLPALIRKLIYASTEPSTSIEMPSGEGVQRHGWDGIVEAPSKSRFVPAGISGWEISVDQRPADKAERDFKARTKDSLGLSPSETTFVFVTARKWDGKQKWRDEKRNLGEWKGVEVYDSSDLEAWLEIAPGVDAWLAGHLKRRPPGVISISDHWESVSRLCEPPLRPVVFLASREKTEEKLCEFLLGKPCVMPIVCRSPTEALDFVAAYLETVKAEDAQFAMDDDDRIRVQSRTVVVKDRAQWDGLSQEDGHLTLLPMLPLSLSLTAEELNAAVGHGHRVLIAAAQFSNHRVQPVSLPQPSRYELEEALRKSGFDREHAKRASLAAGGSLSVLKRHLSMIPSAQLPSWCRSPELADFLPILLIGAWDDANEADRNSLSQLSNRPYGELRNVATRLTLTEDPPLTRNDTRWRLVSPEDSWCLAGEGITAELLRTFEKIAIEVLRQQNRSLSQSTNKRVDAYTGETRGLRASALLRRGIAETTAILGSDFGPLAKLRGTEEHAATIVRAVLQSATWRSWDALGDVLPLLAEAAPTVFLDAISIDLKRKRPELATLLADDGDNALLSRCKHAGLLWALEAIAWSSDLFPRTCTLLAGLDAVDKGGTWGNRPVASLREILLPWYPQTAAGVEKRIAVLKSLADQTPAVAWKLLFAMMPQGLSHADLTHRPIWRDWTSTWREGTSDADYWKQVNAAAELIVRLVGNDPKRWSKVLDELHLVPEPYRNQLIGRLRNLPVDQIDADERRRFAEHLRKTIQRHHDLAEANWALPTESIDALEQTWTHLLPVGIREQHAWLFVPWPKLEGFRDKRKEMEEEIDRLRADALREIIDQDGFNGVLKLADIVESPGHVGATLAKLDYVLDDQILPGLLRSSNDKHALLAGEYTRKRISCAGLDWMGKLSLDKWSARDAGVFLSLVGVGPQTWDFAASLGEEVSREYWKTVEYWKSVPIPSRSPLNRQQIEFACQKLMEADRPESAIGILSGVTYDEVTASPSIVMDALAAYQNWRQSNPDARCDDDTLRTIQRLFEWLQKNPQSSGDEQTQRLGQLEWEFLWLLDGFAQLIAEIGGSNDERESGTKLAETRRNASDLYRLLMNWNYIPGSQSDGSIDEEQLLRWLESARSLCRDSGHLEIADSQIGEMLARWPQPQNEDTMWPCEEICDAIEEADSDNLDRGFQIGVLNSRGVTTRSPLDGGDLERKEAAKYRGWAKRCDIDWPRTAASLRSVESSYQFQAEREDSRAAERAQERY